MNLLHHKIMIMKTLCSNVTGVTGVTLKNYLGYHKYNVCVCAWCVCVCILYIHLKKNLLHLLHLLQINDTKGFRKWQCCYNLLQPVTK